MPGMGDPNLDAAVAGVKGTAGQAANQFASSALFNRLDTISQYHPDIPKGSLYPQQGEDFNAWSARLDGVIKKYPDTQNIIESTRQMKTLKTGETTPQGAQLMQYFDKNSAGAAGSANGPLDRNKAIDDFYRMMMDPNAPELKAAQEQASIRSQQGMEGRGIGGGMENASVARAGLDSRNALQFQRQQAGINALHQGMGYDLNKSGQTFDQNQSLDLNNKSMINGLVQGGIAAAGQIGSAYAGRGSGAGTGASGGGYESPAAGMTSPYGGVGAGSNASVTQPSEWNNPYGGY